MATWTILGAPLDSSGSGRGEEAAPAALRAAGLAKSLGARDAGDVTQLLRPGVRDQATGVIAVEALRRACADLSEAVAQTLRRGERPFVVGGDCSLLPGALAGARAEAGRLGLWFVDGHADFLDGESSLSGEAADMNLAMATGHGPPGLADLGAPPPLVAAGATVILGHRPSSLGSETAAELARVPAELATVTADAVRSAGAGTVGRDWARRLSAGGPAWLHLDLDALDAEVMPAVTYPQPAGLRWEDFEELVAPLLADTALVGVSLADLNPDRDPGGACTRRVVETVARLAG